MRETKIKNLTITAVIAAYNAEKYVARAIGSILGQTRHADEIIVVDDGSTDDTAKVVRSFGDKIKLIQQPNSGVSAARNAGITAAKGDWIAFLDADDEWLPQFLERQEALIGRHPELVWSTANYITCSCSENRQSPYVAIREAERNLNGSEVIQDYLHGSVKGLWGCSDTMFIRKAVFEKSGLFDIKLSKGEDLDTWWRISYYYPQIGFISEPLAIYHLGVPDSGNKKKQSMEHYVYLISKHMELSRQFGRNNSFKLLADKMYRGWMRGLLFYGNKEVIRYLLKHSRSIVPYRVRSVFWCLTIFPVLTQKVCLIVSKIVRTLNLRRRVVVPPKAK